jgi:hypothetical protein
MSSSSAPGGGSVLLRVLGVATAAVGALAVLTTIKRQTDTHADRDRSLARRGESIKEEHTEIIRGSKGRDAIRQLRAAAGRVSVGFV